MRFPEVTEIINSIDTKEAFTTYDANIHLPKLSTRQVASILRRDERIRFIRKKWLWAGCNHWSNISVWGLNEQVS